MKILHVLGGSINSGASKGALLLHQHLLKLDVDSNVLCEDYSNDAKVFSTSLDFKDKIQKRYRSLIDKLPKIFYFKRKPSSFSNNIIGYDLQRNKHYQSADIIHLHWVNNGFFNLSDLKEINKPIVWTMRDMWVFTGGCHYSLGCKKYEKKCFSCPQLSNYFFYDLSSYNQNRKKKYYNKDIKFVAVSNWLKEKAKNSYLLKSKNIYQINNIIDKNNFFLEKKIKKNDLINITFGAENLNSSYKGLEFFLKTLKYIDTSKYRFNFFGKLWDFEKIDKLNINYKYHGYISSTKKLRKIYSMTDIFVACSLEDAFPKTFIEAMLCETTVICFKGTVFEEFVKHKKNGYCAEYLSINDFVRGINWISENKERMNKLKKLANQTAKLKINGLNSAKKYISLYKQLI